MRVFLLVDIFDVGAGGSIPRHVIRDLQVRSASERVTESPRRLTSHPGDLKATELTSAKRHG